MAALPSSVMANPANPSRSISVAKMIVMIQYKVFEGFMLFDIVGDEIFVATKLVMIIQLTRVCSRQFPGLIATMHHPIFIV
jgi:hypothetical protein